MTKADVGWVEHDGYWTCRINGSVVRCVSCDKPIEYAGPETCRANHKCPPDHEGGKAAMNRAHQEPMDRDKSFGQRLTEGWEMLGENE